MNIFNESWEKTYSGLRGSQVYFFMVVVIVIFMIIIPATRMRKISQMCTQACFSAFNISPSGLGIQSSREWFRMEQVGTRALDLKRVLRSFESGNEKNSRNLEAFGSCSHEAGAIHMRVIVSLFSKNSRQRQSSYCITYAKSLALLPDVMGKDNGHFGLRTANLHQWIRTTMMLLGSSSEEKTIRKGSISPRCQRWTYTDMFYPKKRNVYPSAQPRYSEQNKGVKLLSVHKMRTLANFVVIWNSTVTDALAR